MTNRIQDAKTDPHERSAPAVRSRPMRHALWLPALAILVAGSFALMPVPAGAASPGAKSQRIVPGSANAQTRESPYVRFNRQHLEASGTGPAAAGPQAVHRPPKLAGQVQRR